MTICLASGASCRGGASLAKRDFAAAALRFGICCMPTAGYAAIWNCSASPRSMCPARPQSSRGCSGYLLFVAFPAGTNSFLLGRSGEKGKRKPWPRVVKRSSSTKRVPYSTQTRKYEVRRSSMRRVPPGLFHFQRGRSACTCRSPSRDLPRAVPQPVRLRPPHPAASHRHRPFRA